MTRTERQTDVLKKWIFAGCIGSFIGATGFGKTRIGLRAIKWFVNSNPESKILIVVPTEYLKNQWITLLEEWELTIFCEVLVINTVIKRTFDIDFLIIDEVHIVPSTTFKEVFNKVRYKIALGLTGTMDRLDGKETLIKSRLPVFDEVNINECITNDWLADFREYKVMIDVDLTEYNTYTQEFTYYFSMFNFDFNLAMSMLAGKQGIINRRIYANKVKMDYKVIDTYAFGFNRALQARKSFILNHPRKIDLANLILDHRPDAKAITFSQSIEMANLIDRGNIVHSKLTKKKRSEIESAFNDAEKGVLNAVKSLDLGADIQGINLGIVLCGTSSSIQSKQRRGRTIRKEGDKISEIFHLILRGTVEEEWFRKSSIDSSIIPIDEGQLMSVLTHNEIEDKSQKENKFLFRF